MDGDSDSNAKHVDSLLRMGFKIDAIDAVLGEANPGSSLEDLVMSLSAYISSDTGGANANYDQYHRADAKYSYDVHDSASNSPGKGGTDTKSKEALALLKFVKEAADEGEIIDENELNAKFVIAESVLDSFDRSARAELGPADAMLGLIRWAEDMKMLAHDALTAFEEELPCSTMCFNCKDGLVEWYKQLELTRQEMDQAAVAGNMLSDAELHRMAELDKIAAMGTADEQMLHNLISRHEEVSKEVNNLHRQCGLLVASERGVKRENLEELYLYLKQQVASGMDLDMITDELHEHVYSLVSSARGAEVTNLLLDMHIHEDEQNMLKKRIDTILGVPISQQQPDAAVDFLGEEQVHVEDAYPGQPNYADEKRSMDSFSDSKSSAQNSFGPHGGANLSPAKHSGESSDGSSKHSSPMHNGVGGIGGVNVNLAQRLQQQQDQQQQSMFVADGKTSAHGAAGAGVGDGSNKESYLNALKDQHRSSVAQLKDLLEAEKARRLKALEDKLMRRRALQQTQQRKNDDHKGGAMGADLAAEHARAVREVEVEIEEVQVKFDGMVESLVSGLKKRCLNEILVARRNHDKDPEGTAFSDGKHSGAPLLSEEDRREAHRAAADSLKARFERDQKALLDSLEQERTKQHDRMAKQLAAKRKAKLASGATEQSLAAEEQAALVAMNVEFDTMQALALSNAQEHALLALAAIHLTEADLASDRSKNAEDDDDYLNEDNVTSSGGCLTKGRDWLERVDRVKVSYMGAASELIQRLRVNAVNTGAASAKHNGAGGEEEGQAFSEVAGLMSKVVTDAFDNQLLEETSNKDFSSNDIVNKSGKFAKKIDSRADGARLKAGILEEFERAKREMDESLQHAQQASKNKLNDRRQKGRSSAGSGGGDEGKENDDDQEAKALRLQKLHDEILEGVVDAFLGDEPLPDLAVAYTAASTAQGSMRAGLDSQNALRRVSAEYEEDDRDKERARIKNVHAQKEQTLLQDLQANMLEKKRALEDRLRRKRQNGSSHGHGTSSHHEEHSSEHDAAETEVNMLTEAFDKISAQLKGMSKDQLSQLDLNLLVDLMERSANGERVHLPAGSPLKPIVTNATLARPSAVSPDSAKNANSNPFSVSPSHQAQPLLAPVLPPLRGLAGAGVGAISVSEEKAAMAGEVKRISLEYNEEKQKLDLMMKIQQARQRQLLQRKLFEKSQRKQQEQQQQQQRADGLFDIDEDGNEYTAYADGKSEYNSVEIGANRGLSNLKLKQANSLQPAFKGLPADAYKSGAAAGGGAGYSSGKPANQGMALRGMNLGPMMRK
uniref:Uncharacterized protein n=1 Tax=Spumella elongata TaxID=89044 RepID=A0A7S3MHV4_9STRA